MTEFLRPRSALYSKLDVEGNSVTKDTPPEKRIVIGFTDGTQRTNCILPKDHDGPCQNIRGECMGQGQRTEQSKKLALLERQVKELMQEQERLREEREQLEKALEE
jgi:hypothetical protein